MSLIIRSNTSCIDQLILKTVSKMVYKFLIYNMLRFIRFSFNFLCFLTAFNKYLEYFHLLEGAGLKNFLILFNVSKKLYLK